MFESVLVANRGEIAVRIIRTLSALGMRSVAVYSDADANAPHVHAADRAIRLGPESPALSYLSVERIVAAASRSGVQAIHPGYGFVSESAAFARACADAGIVFIGPPPEAIAAMGDKIRAKAMVEAAGVPVVPGAHHAGMDDAALAEAAATIGYPLLVKPAAGGGGRGMRVVADPATLQAALEAARREALGAFGDDSLFLEKLVPAPRHVEVQVFADAHGGIVHLGERECSLQRRHQKIVEECPSPLVDDDTRRRIGGSAVAVAQACGYVGAGTVEFLVSGEATSGEDLQFFFLEMNTRLQVEHTVTEEVFGIDLVEWQLRVAAGEQLPLAQAELHPRGHALQARIYAEDPDRDFLPTGGTILGTRFPRGDGVRVDSGIDSGTVVGSAYDPLLAKVIATDSARSPALRRLRGALDRCVILGVTTNTGFLSALLDDPDVRHGRLDTGLVRRYVERREAPPVPDLVLAAAGLARLAQLQPQGPRDDPFELPGGWRLGQHAWTRWRIRAARRVAVVAVRGTSRDAQVQVDDGPVRRARAVAGDGRLSVWIGDEHVAFATAVDGPVVWLAARGLRTWACEDVGELATVRTVRDSSLAALTAPMPGTVTAVHVAAGDVVRAAQPLVVVEAMKMEHEVTAAHAGSVRKVDVRPGDRVALGQVLVVVDRES